MNTIHRTAIALCLLLPTVGFADDAAQESARAKLVLASLEPYLQEQPTEVLFQMFYTDINADIVNPVGSMYRVMQDGNALIKKELAKRLPKDQPVIQSHIHDKRQLFTGYNGPFETVGEICKGLLKRSTDKSNRPVVPTAANR